MENGQPKDELSVIEAINILSNMAEVDVRTIVEDDEEDYLDPEEINWKNPKQAMRQEPLVRETFRILHKYLQNMVRRDRSQLNDPQIQKGIQALMSIATEAAHKMDKLSGLAPATLQPISKLKEYKDLQKYYKQQIHDQMGAPIKETEDWEEDLEQDMEGITEEKLGIKDLEAVRRDQNYELFFIKNEANRPYFTKSLLRHVRLLGNFDELLAKAEGEDPLLRLREMYDYELHDGAKEAITECAPFLDEFYKKGMKHKDRPYEGGLNKSIMALRMAANSQNLIENQSFKSCLEYYADFHRFLRASLKAPRYIKGIAGEMDDDPYTHTVLRLTHALCCAFFLRKEPRKEALSLIDAMIKRGDELTRQPKEKAKEKALQFWIDLAHEDKALRHLASHYPNGPLMRTLDMFREEEEYEGYDPLMHYNFPADLFALKGDGFHVSCLRIPTPVQQTHIHKAEVVEEFKGFLRFLKNERKPDKHLLINLQDRTSWQNIARVQVLDKLALESEFYETFFTLGLAKGTPFHTQSDPYHTLNGAPVFMEQFEEQLLSGPEAGYHFPDSIEQTHVEKFIKPAFALIHEAFFDSKTTLTRLERVIFIELFYVLFTLKMIELTNVDSISFTCKDAIDTGMGQSAIFYGFLQLMSTTKSFGKKEKDQLQWILYSPALLIRERPIHLSDFNLTRQVLETVQMAIQKNQKAIQKKLNGLYKTLNFPLSVS